MARFIKGIRDALAENGICDADRVAHVGIILDWLERPVETVIVTRHAGAVEWLAAQGITGTVISHVTEPAQVAGKAVIGALPLHLAASTARIGSIDMPNLAAADRGRDLTPEEMDAAGAAIRWYVVEAI